MISIIVFHALMLLVGLGVATRLIPEQLIVDSLSYLHTTIGITTPQPQQSRMIALIWIGSTVVIVDGCVLLLLIVTSLVK